MTRTPLQTFEREIITSFKDLHGIVVETLEPHLEVIRNAELPLIEGTKVNFKDVRHGSVSVRPAKLVVALFNLGEAETTYAMDYSAETIVANLRRTSFNNGYRLSPKIWTSSDERTQEQINRLARELDTARGLVAHLTSPGMVFDSVEIGAAQLAVAGKP